MIAAHNINQLTTLEQTSRGGGPAYYIQNYNNIQKYETKRIIKISDIMCAVSELIKTI